MAAYTILRAEKYAVHSLFIFLSLSFFFFPARMECDIRDVIAFVTCVCTSHIIQRIPSQHHSC